MTDKRHRPSDDPNRCVLCEWPQSALIQRGTRHAPEMEVRRCGGCGLVFLWPRPTMTELERYYREVYREDYADPAVAERYRADLEEARTRAQRLMPLLRPEARVLEVGCGSGAFLNTIRPHVAEVLGVEPESASRTYIEREIKLPVLADVAEALREGKTFDLVVLWHVLEHVPDPVDFLRTLGRLVGPRGRLVIEVPNVDDALVAVYRVPSYLRFYYQKAHLYYFSRSTLARALERAGFAAVIEGVQRYDLSNHIRWMLTGEPGGRGHYDSMLLPSVEAAYAEALIRVGAADTLWAVARMESPDVPGDGG